MSRGNTLAFATPQPGNPAKALTIAGSDSGGAAGLQADLRTLAALGVYGMSVVTAVTAQNSLLVTAVHPLPPDFVAAQLDAVLSDYGAEAVKTGFLGRVPLIQIIAGKIRAYQLPNVIIDPVLVNHKGEAMFAPDVPQAYIGHLFPLAHLVTPNRREAALLTGTDVTSVADMETAATRIHARGPQHVLITGGRAGGDAVDVLYDGRSFTHLHSPHIETQNTHGSGDTLSAAVCALLARGVEMETAVRQAHQFTAQAIQKAAAWHLGQGHGPVAQW